MSVSTSHNYIKKSQVFTPRDLVIEILDRVGYRENLYNKKIIDNSCGNGNFLTEIVIRYINDCKSLGFPLDKIRVGLSNDIFGIEIDPILHKECINRLDKIALSSGIDLVQWNIICQDSLKYIPNINFDFIVGNPPYISYWNIDKEYRKFIKENFSTCKNGAFDYSYAFWEQGLKYLKDNGKMGYLVPNSLLKTKSGQALRKSIQKNISTIIIYPRKKIFTQAQISPIILILDKSISSEKISFYNKTDKKSFSLDKKTLQDKWFLLEDNLEQKKTNRLGDYFEIHTCIATQLNKAFILPHSEWKYDGKFYFNGHFYVESEIVRPAVSPKSLAYNLVENIIFPYKYTNKKIVRFSDTEFKTLYPETCKYLSNLKTDLLARDSEKRAKWFEYGRSQALQTCCEDKLVFSPFITNKFNVYRVSSNSIPYSGLFLTVKEDNISLTLNDAYTLLTSKDFFNYIYPRGVYISGKSVRITAKEILEYRW